MAYIKVGKDTGKRTKRKRGKCVEPGKKPNWHAPHKQVKSSFNGEKLMTTRYVSKGKKKKPKCEDGWRGNDFGRVNDAALTPERFGIVPPSWFQCSEPVRKLVR